MGYLNEPTNEDRVDRIDAIREFYKDSSDDDEALVRDILTDLMHFCDDEGMDFNARLEMARMHYEEEK